jgi:hypothetical protein
MSGPLVYDLHICTITNIINDFNLLYLLVKLLHLYLKALALVKLIYTCIYI